MVLLQWEKGFWISVLVLMVIPDIFAETTTTKAPAPDVYCYTCESWKEGRCSDPYNKEALTPNYCTGSCFKANIKSAPKDVPTGIRRGCFPDKVDSASCTDFQTTDGASGNICYCPKDRCNTATSITRTSTSQLFLMASILYISVYFVTL